MFLREFKLFILVLLSAAMMWEGCSHILVRTPAPEPCSPTPRGVVCSGQVIDFPDAYDMICYPADTIEQFMERYSR